MALLQGKCLLGIEKAGRGRRSSGRACPASMSPRFKGQHREIMKDRRALNLHRHDNIRKSCMHIYIDVHLYASLSREGWIISVISGGPQRSRKQLLRISRDDCTCSFMSMKQAEYSEGSVSASCVCHM